MACLTDWQQKRLISAFDQIPALYGIGIGFVGSDSSCVIRSPFLPGNVNAWVILEEVKEERNQEPEPAIILEQTKTTSRTGKEVLNLVMSCGSAVLTGAAAVVGAGAAPFTGGASLVLTYIGGAAAVASAGACGLAIGRMVNNAYDPTLNDLLDSSGWYQVTSTTLDAIQLAGGVASLGGTARAALRLSRTTGRPLKDILRQMSRADRKRLAEDLAKYTKKAATRKQFIRLARKGEVPKIYSQKAITKGIRQALLESSSAILDMISSALSGNVRQVIVYFAE